MKLLIADDHTLFRDALVQYIERAEPEARVTLCKDFHEAFSSLKKDNKYDLVLLDLRMPGMNGIGGVHQIKKEYPELRLALMSGVAEEKDVNEAMNAGACGYFPKTLSGKALLKAIQLVMTGERYMPIQRDTNDIMPSYYADAVNLSIPNSNLNVADIGLTPRENEVLSMLTQGMSNKEIARKLDLQVVTVKLHVRGICRKLDAKNRTQAAMIAHRMGLSSAG